MVFGCVCICQDKVCVKEYFQPDKSEIITVFLLKIFALFLYIRPYLKNYSIDFSTFFTNELVEFWGRF